jgi:multidrug efflux pump subunit AcrB
VDLKRMAELNLAPAQVIGAVQSENANIPAGFVDLGPRSFSLKTSGSYTSLDQVRDTVIASVDGRIVRIRDVAEVSWNSSAYSHTGRFKGRRAVFVTANQKDGYNILEVRERVVAAAKAYAANMPKRVSLEIGFDQSENVRHRLNRLYGDFGIAIALVLLTLLPLGGRAAGIVMISIPLSLSFGLACLYFLGYSLNQLSIASRPRSPAHARFSWPSSAARRRSSSPSCPCWPCLELRASSSACCRWRWLRPSSVRCCWRCS